MNVLERKIAVAGGVMLRNEKEQYLYLSRGFKYLKSEILCAVPTFFSVVLATATIAGAAIGLSQPAHALPSFARQTGQPCGTCHTDYFGLSPYGRLFKINGYTTGGGKFRTTLFPLRNDPTNALAAYAKQTDGGKYTNSTGQPDTSNIWVPPISMMAIYGYTHTQKDQPMGSPYHANDNANLNQLSFFFGGAITDHIGLFSQFTYGNAPYGGSAVDPTTGGPVPVTNPCWNCEWAWDNIDLRYANTGMLGGTEFVYGITANNNPTVQDPWNTTPAWGFPYNVSNIADGCCGPSSGGYTLLDGLAQLAGGAGAYVFIDNLVYLELTAYLTLDFKTLPKLGANPFDLPGLSSGVAPYWRAAVEPHWGNNWLEFGTFGMVARFHPWTGADSVGDGSGYELNQVFPQTDRYTDIGFDSQYQYQGDNYWITLRGTYIRESQNLDASFNNGLSSNLANRLNSLKAYASLAYGNDNRIVLTGQYFKIRGTSDALVYADLNSCQAPDTTCSPNSSGYVAEIAYIPFISSNSPIWPWANVRVGLQYTYYNKFDGTTLNAHDNNSLFLYAWFAM
jgi:hypothetical protein